MNIPSVSCDDAGADPLTIKAQLPNEILLHIFRYFNYEDLVRIEQVCLQWKTVVEMCFATKKRLSLEFVGGNYSYSIKKMERYGSSIKTLKLTADVDVEVDCASHEVNWAEEIADRFPNLITMELCHIRISDDGFKYLSTKCRELNNLRFFACGFAIEGLSNFLQALPGIKVLKFFKVNFNPGLVIPNLADILLAVLSNCRNLHTFVIGCRYFTCTDTALFSRFLKECVTLRTLRLLGCYLPNEMFAQIQHCSLLEELDLRTCCRINDSSLIEISKGCPNLRVVNFVNLQRVSDEGLKYFARCKHLYSFRSCGIKVTDETLVELSKCVNLREVKVSCSSVSDRGCAALLAHCPRLEVLSVKGCEGVSNATVDSAIESVKSRQNGSVLKLEVKRTGVTPHKYENCHPLLHLSYCR